MKCIFWMLVVRLRIFVNGSCCSLLKVARMFDNTVADSVFQLMARDVPTIGYWYALQCLKILCSSPL